MALGPGSVLGERYELGSRIGSGGMADVYQATDRRLGRDVAVKLLRLHTADESDRARFAAEARTLARLQHPGLVMVLDAGTSQEQPYLVMRLVAGRTLGEKGRVRLDESVQIGRQVADALVYVHRKGLVHRDVKPGNILLDDSGRVFLADFGIARLVDDQAHHTRTGMTVGSPAYLSPEQVRGATVGPACDVYSLGLVLIESVTGAKAFPGSSTEQAMVRLTRGPSIPDTLAPRMRDLLTAMTSMAPDQRPTSEEVADALSSWSDPTTATPAVTRSLTQVMPTVDPRPDPNTGLLPEVVSLRRGPSTKALMAAGLAVLLLLLLLLPAMTDKGGGSEEAMIPDGIPAELRAPLRDLHRAVEVAP